VVPSRSAPIYRISRNGQEPIIDIDQVEGIEPEIRSSELGRCQVDEISADPLPSGHTPRRCGIGIKREDGSVELEPETWPNALAIGRPLGSLILNGSTLLPLAVLLERERGHS
jgi:hypothetical protein